MRHITQDGLNLIKFYEGFSPTTYICPAGYKTIGYGHLVRHTESFDTITEQQAVELLKKDVKGAENAVLRLINIPLNDGQYNALVSFTFNLGSGALQRSTLRQRINRNENNYDCASEFDKWIYAGGRILSGLVKRRKAEKLMYLFEEPVNV